MIVTIREAVAEDYKELMKLYNEFVGKETFSKHDNDSFQQVLDYPTTYIYVAEGEGKLLGFAAFSTRFVVRYPKHIMQLDELFVSEEYRKHGVGGRLIEIVEERARDLDCAGIYIESSVERKTAHKFYEELGYKNSGFYFKKTI